VRKADNLPKSCAVVTKSGNLNYPEPFGPVQACNGTALPLHKASVTLKLRTNKSVAQVLYNDFTDSFLKNTALISTYLSFDITALRGCSVE